MRIDSIYIAAFGGLSNYSLKLSDGFNVIYGENENGKSTVMAFIKMMFYGSGRSVSQISRNPRKKYLPWSGAAMGGRIEFEHGGKHYLLEREFRNSDATDKVQLTDTGFGTVQTVQSDVGQRFFGLSAAAFERSVFIGQLGAAEADSNAEGEINSRLSNIALTGDESISYDTVNNRLTKARLALLSKSGRAGILDKNRAALTQLKAELDSAAKAEQTRGELAATVQSVKKEIEELEAGYAKLRQTVDSENDVRNAKKLAELLEVKSQLDSLNTELRLNDGGCIDKAFVAKVSFCFSRLDAIQLKIDALDSEIETLAKGIELAEHPTDDMTPERQSQLSAELTQLNNRNSELDDTCRELEKHLNDAENSRTAAQNAKKAVNLPLIIVGAALAVCAVVLFVMSLTVPGIVSGAAGVLAAVLGFVLRPSDKRAVLELDSKIIDIKTRISDAKNAQSEIHGKITASSSRLEAITAVLNSSSAIIEHQKSTLADRTGQLDAQKSDYKTELDKLLTLYSRYREESDPEKIRAELDVLSQKAEEQKQIKSRLNYISGEVGNISYDEARERLEKAAADSAGTEIDFEKEKQRLDALGNTVNEKKAELFTAQAELKTVSRSIKNPAVIENEITALEEKIEVQTQFCTAAELASQVLTESFAEVRRSYGSVLEKKALDIFSRLTGGRYSNMSVSKSLNISVEPADIFGTRDIDYLSSGTADQAYLSLRLAVSELITADGEPLPVMLDDVLTQYDDNRTAAAVEFLKEYSQNGQIIMFTCHRAVSDTANAAGAAAKSL